jgi:hypothetical protein
VSFPHHRLGQGTRRLSRQGTLTRNGLRGGAVKSENSKNKSVDTNKYENEGEYPPRANPLLRTRLLTVTFTKRTLLFVHMVIGTTAFSLVKDDCQQAST